MSADKAFPQQIRNFVLAVELSQGFARKLFYKVQAQCLHPQPAPDWGRDYESVHQLWLNARQQALRQGELLSEVMAAKNHRTKRLRKLLNAIARDGANAAPNGEYPEWEESKARLEETALQHQAAADRKTLPTKKAEGTGTGSDPAGGEQAEGTNAGSEQTRDDASPSLSPSRLKAFTQYRWAVQQNAELDGATDLQVYNWLAEHLEDGDELPSFASWGRYVRQARAAGNTRKNTSRRGRQTGRSIVRRDEI